MQAQTDRPWHAVTWLVWAVAATTALQLAPSPPYVVLVIAIAWFMVAQHSIDGPMSRAFPILVGVALVFALIRIALTAATTHGSSEVWFTTPSIGMPELLGGFDVGGPVSGPIVLQAAQESLVVVGIVAVFAAFNAVVSHYELVQTVPRAFYELGLIVVIALAVVPTTIEAVHDAREADRARTGGRVVRKGRLVRQMVPVLERGLERAVTLSESLDSRGFAHSGASARQRGAGWLGLGALLALGGAFVALVGREDGTALVLALVGGVALVAAVVLSSRATHRIRYRPRAMRLADWACVGAVLLTPLTLVVLVVTGGDGSFVWTPSPVRWPQVDVVAALSLVPLLAPLARTPAPAASTSPEMRVA